MTPGIQRFTQQAGSGPVHVTFDVPGVSMTGLLGRNDAGKTTLLRIIAGHGFASVGRVAALGGQPGQGRGGTVPDGVHPGGLLGEPYADRRRCSKS
jgi:ABC-type uncharacterized transport system ATPase subunit